MSTSNTIYNSHSVGIGKTKIIPPSEMHITPEAMPSTGLTGPSETATYYTYSSDDVSGVTGPALVGGSSTIAFGTSNIAYGSMTTPTTGSYIAIGGGIPISGNFSSSGSYTFPATYTITSTSTLPFNDENQNPKIEKLEERVKELEDKLEKILEMIEDKTIFKISI